MTDQTYSRDDLLTAWLNRQRYESAHPDLSGYWTARSAALAAAFDVDLDREPTGQWWLYGLFAKAADDYLRVHNPFSDYLEEPPEIAPFYDRHSSEIASCCDALREAYRALMVDLMEEMWELAPERKLTRSELIRNGFDPEATAPDPLDYW